MDPCISQISKFLWDTKQYSASNNSQVNETIRTNGLNENPYPYLYNHHEFSVRGLV